MESRFPEFFVDICNWVIEVNGVEDILFLTGCRKMFTLFNLTLIDL